MLNYNQIGLLQFCQAQGAVEGEVVALQRSQLRQPPPAKIDEADEMEKAGRQGIIAFGGSRVTMTDAAMGQGVTLRFRCEQLARIVQAQNASTSR